MIWGENFWNNRKYSNTVGAGHFSDYEDFIKREINVRAIKRGYRPPSGSISQSVKAYINHGRLVADCPFCGGAEILWENDPRFVCLSCFNESIGGQFLSVETPSQLGEIEALLENRPIPFQNWNIGESLKKLQTENELAAWHFSWTAPRTWVSGEVVTAALMNTHVRDNMLETAPADVTTAGDLVYATGANAITRLAIGTARQLLQTNSGATAPEWVTRLGAVGHDYVATQNADTRSSWTDISGLSITLNPGTDRFAIIAWAGFHSITGDDSWQIRVDIGGTSMQESPAGTTGFSVGSKANNTASTAVKAQYYVGGTGTDSMDYIFLVAIAVPD